MAKVIIGFQEIKKKLIKKNYFNLNIYLNILKKLLTKVKKRD